MGPLLEITLNPWQYLIPWRPWHAPKIRNTRNLLWCSIQGTKTRDDLYFKSSYWDYISAIWTSLTLFHWQCGNHSANSDKFTTDKFRNYVKIFTYCTCKNSLQAEASDIGRTCPHMYKIRSRAAYYFRCLLTRPHYLRCIHKHLGA